MVLPDSTTPGPSPSPGPPPFPFTRDTQTDLTPLLTFRGLPHSTFLTRLTVGHMNLYAHAQRRPFSDEELLAFRDAARAASSAYWSVKIPLDLAALALCVVPYRRLPRFLRYLPRAMMEKPLVGFMPGSMQHGIVVGTFRLSLFFCATGVSALPAMWRFQTVAVREEDNDPRLAGCVTMRNLNLTRAELDGFVQATREGRVAYTVREQGAAGPWGLLGGGGGAGRRTRPRSGRRRRGRSATRRRRTTTRRRRRRRTTGGRRTGGSASRRRRRRRGSLSGDSGRSSSRTAPRGRRRTTRPRPSTSSSRRSRRRRRTRRRLAPSDPPPPRPLRRPRGRGRASAPRPGSGTSSSSSGAATARRLPDRRTRGRRGGAGAAAGGGDAAQQDGVEGAGGRRGGAGEEERRDFERRMARERQGRDSDAGERRRW